MKHKETHEPRTPLEFIALLAEVVVLTAVTATVIAVVVAADAASALRRKWCRE